MASGFHCCCREVSCWSKQGSLENEWLFVCLLFFSLLLGILSLYLWFSAASLCQTEVRIFFLILKIFIYLFIYLFIYFWLHWVFVAVHGLSLVAASRGYSSLRCTGFSLQWLLLLWSTGSRRAGFSSCGSQAQLFMACGIFPDQGLNLCPLHWQADSYPLHHRGSLR